MNATPTDHRPPKREITLRTQAITADDLVLLKDLDAVAHLKRCTRTQVVADIVQRTLGPKFAPQVAAA
jgi:hypothetical protein